MFWAVYNGGFRKIFINFFKKNFQKYATFSASVLFYIVRGNLSVGLIAGMPE